MRVDKSHLGVESLYGCSDMVGNASKWTLSEIKPYPYSEKDGRNEIEREKFRVIREEYWFTLPIRARVSVRGMHDTFFTDIDIGFRFLCEE